MIDTFEKLKNISLQFGLIVSENKPKYIKCTKGKKKKHTHTHTHIEGLTVDSMHINKVRSFSYLGNIVNGNNTLEKEIRGKIYKWNTAIYANKSLFKSNLVSRKSKLMMYWSLIRPIVVYGCKIWVLKESII
jgi:hypothetical protein